MTASLNRIIFYVNDVSTLKRFYQHHFACRLVEEVDGEWVVLGSGPTELAFHRIGEAYRKSEASAFRAESNAKIVFEIDTDIHQFRADLIASNVSMQAVKSYPGFAYLLCDGEDPEGNRFQLMKREALPALR